MRAYAQEKMERLERRAPLHDVTLTLDLEPHRIPAAVAEVVVHMHHTLLTARAEATGLQEAIDRVVDKADEQIRRRQERVASRKGAPGADGEEPRRTAVAAVSAPAGGMIHERRARLRPMSADDAIAEMERRDLPYLLYLDEAGGDVAVVSRRAGGGYDLVLADTR